MRFKNKKAAKSRQLFYLPYYRYSEHTVYKYEIWCVRIRLALARQEGFEPPTYWFVASHSIQLSYWRIGA